MPDVDLLAYVPPMRLPAAVEARQSNGLDLPIVVINLPHRTDRWETLRQRMDAIGLDKLVRAPAVMGAELPKTQIAALTRSPAEAVDAAPRSHLDLTRPAVGCFLSHLAIWRWVVETGLPRVLVFEDDAAPAADFDAGRLGRVLTATPPDARLLFLGRITMHGLAEKPSGGDLARLYYFNGTFAYVATQEGCRTLLQNLFPLRAHVDHQMSRFFIDRRADFVALAAEPPFFEPDWSLRSDCYVPLEGEADADRVLGQEFDAYRRLLLGEGRPLVDV